jgi:hypothetical protein
MIRDVPRQFCKALSYLAELIGRNHIYGDASILPLHGVCVLPRRRPREPNGNDIRRGIADIESFLAEGRPNVHDNGDLCQLVLASAFAWPRSVLDRRGQCCGGRVAVLWLNVSGIPPTFGLSLLGACLAQQLTAFCDASELLGDPVWLVLDEM